MNEKQKINELFEDVYTKYFNERDENETTNHENINDVKVYIAEYKKSEDFFFISYKGIDLYKNGKIVFDDYSNFVGRTFYLETFVDFMREKLINGLNDECDQLFFFSYKKESKKTETVTIQDNSFKVKADILDTILSRKLIIE